MFLTKVKYTKQNPNGTFKRVVETYLFDALGFTECEARVYECLEKQIHGEFMIVKMDRFQVDDLLMWQESKDKFFIAKLDFENIDGVAVKLKFLINDNIIEGAKARLSLFLTEHYSPNLPTLKSIAETPILEYFPQDEQATDEI